MEAVPVPCRNFFRPREQCPRKPSGSAVPQRLDLLPCDALRFEILVEPGRIVGMFFSATRNAEQFTSGLRACGAVTAYPDDVFQLYLVEQIHLIKLGGGEQP